MSGSIFDDIFRGLAQTTAIFDTQRKMKELIEQSGISAAQASINETVQKFRSALAPGLESELYRHNHAIDVAIQNGRAFTDSMSDHIRESLKAVEAGYQLPYIDAEKHLRERLSFGHNLVEDAASRVAQDLGEHIRLNVVSWETAVPRAIKDIVQSYSTALRTHFDPLQEESRRQAAKLQEIQKMAFPMLSTIAEQLIDVFRLQLPMSALEVSFSGQLLDRLQTAETLTSEAAWDDYLDEFVNWLAEKVGQLPRARISLEGILSILLTIVLYFQSTWSMNQMEERLTARISHFEERVLHKIEELRPRPPLCKVYVVTARLRLRENPSTQARIVQRLSPNTIVEEMGQQGRWLQVRVFDYGEGSVRLGWVYKQYLAPVCNE